MEAQLEYVRVAYMFFASLAQIRMLSRCFLTKISASELSRKLIKSALLVGSIAQCTIKMMMCRETPTQFQDVHPLPRKKEQEA